MTKEILSKNKGILIVGIIQILVLAGLVILGHYQAMTRTRIIIRTMLTCSVDIYWFFIGVICALYELKQKLRGEISNSQWEKDLIWYALMMLLPPVCMFIVVTFSSR